MTDKPKVLVLGVDAMDPRVTKRFMREGIMPNMEKLMKMGAARDDLVMLGGHPTITPPMWCTMSTGAYANVHGFTCFNRQNPDDIVGTVYGFDSANCRAEQMWDVAAQAGYKTLVWHWPGGSWPPTSDNPNLLVVDGTSPGSPNTSTAGVDEEVVLVADVKTPACTYNPKAAADTHIPCMVNNLELAADETSPLFSGKGEGMKVVGKATINIVIKDTDGEGGVALKPFDVVLSPIKDADDKWENAPEGAKELTFLFSQGLVRRPALILKNDEGTYDRVAVYKNKKSAEPLYILHNDVFEENIVDEAIRNDKHYRVTRNMRVVELAEDGTHLKVWISPAMDINCDVMFSPRSLYKTIVDNAGYCPPLSFVGGGDEKLIRDCTGENWTRIGQWYSRALHYMIEKEDIDVIFSHYHNVDLQGHMIVKFLKDKGQLDFKLTEEKYWDLFRMVYKQTDDYIGQFFDLIEKGWDVILVSDHGQVCPEHEHVIMGDPTGCTIPVMRDLGFTVMKKDENGNDTYEIDWTKTRAVANRGNNIYLNLKGRTDHGIVDPEDQYELEEEIITALYGYHSKTTGKRVVAVALRNKDAVLLGYGGPECGDICFWMAEGYNLDHGDSLSTTWGYGETSVSPIFAAAGPHFKEDYRTDRIIRQVDVAPTVAMVLGTRMPDQCEGAPVYQILQHYSVSAE